MAAMMVILVTVGEDTMVVVDQDLEITVVNTMMEEEAMVVTMKEDVLVKVAMVVMGTTMSLEIIMHHSNQIMDP